MAHSPLFKVGTIVWALLIGAGVVVVGGGILLPSTKRAHIDFSRQPRDAAQEAPTTAAASLPEIQALPE